MNFYFIIFTMRLKITFESESHIKIPIHYNYHVQSFIYRNLDRILAERLHDEGIPLGKRRFKFFTFSRLFSPKRKRNGTNWIFSPPLTFYIAARDVNILESFALHLVKLQVARLARVSVTVRSIEVIKPAEFSEELVIKTLSPITVYSTLLTPQGKKKTYYYSPFEKEFNELLKANLQRKFKAIYGMEPTEKDDIFEIEPLKVSVKNEAIIKYKGTIIKGWTGIYKMKISKSYFDIAYNTGLGSKNSQGFGMIEVVRRKKEEHEKP